MALFDLFRSARSETALARVEPRIRAASAETTSTLANPEPWFVDWAGAGGGSFGPPVNERTAMAVSAVYRCVSLKAGLTGSLPLKIYRDDPKLGRVEVPDHQFSRFFGMAPYPGRPMSAYSWREMWTINTELWGNHFSVIRYNQASRVVGFEPALPNQVEVFRRSNGENGYVVTWLDGSREAVPQEDMLHVPGLGFDGIRGLSRVSSFARNSISMAKLLEEQSGRSHENAARPSGALELPPNAKISPDGMRKKFAWFQEKYTGRLNAGTPLLLDPGEKFTPFAISAEDLQTIESRQFQMADICRFFGVPPHLIGEAANTSAWGSGIEQLTIGFLIFTLEADLARIEAELKLKLFTDGSHYPMFDRSAIRALDVVTAAQAAQTEIQSGVLTINERRKQMHRPSVAGGDEPLVNSTMVPLSRALNPPAPAAPPAPGKQEPQK